MFEYESPVQAATAQREFMEDFGYKLPQEIRTKMREFNRSASPVPLLLGGMEVLFVVAREIPLDDDVNAGVLDTLQLVATAVGTSQFGGADIATRAWAIAAWARNEITPTGGTQPAPDVDPAHTTIKPEPVAPPVVPNGPNPPVPPAE